MRMTTLTLPLLVLAGCVHSPAAVAPPVPPPTAIPSAPAATPVPETVEDPECAMEEEG